MIGRFLSWLLGDASDEMDAELIADNAAQRHAEAIMSEEEPRVFDFEDVRNTMTEAEKYEAWYDRMIEGDCV